MNKTLGRDMKKLIILSLIWVFWLGISYSQDNNEKNCDEKITIRKLINNKEQVLFKEIKHIYNLRYYGCYLEFVPVYEYGFITEIRFYYENDIEAVFILSSGIDLTKYPENVNILNIEQVWIDDVYVYKKDKLKFIIHHKGYFKPFKRFR
ncbi:MAG: hypothetical protein ACLGGV_08715 [Bacteroidia bacterium]